MRKVSVQVLPLRLPYPSFFSALTPLLRCLSYVFSFLFLFIYSTSTFLFTDNVGSRVRDLIADASMPIPLSDLTSFGGGTPRSADESSPGVKPSGTGVDGCQTGSLSQKQVEYFIATQVNLLVHNETKALPPKTLQVVVEIIVAISFCDNASLRYRRFC